MADTIKCNCSHCGAKYRLPLEAQGRTAKCKRCGQKFAVPRAESLEDNILTWLSIPERDEEDESVPAKPRVINMQVEDGNEAATEAADKMRGPIRMKNAAPEEKAG